MDRFGKIPLEKGSLDIRLDEDAQQFTIRHRGLEVGRPVAVLSWGAAAMGVIAAVAAVTGSGFTALAVLLAAVVSGVLVIVIGAEPSPDIDIDIAQQKVRVRDQERRTVVALESAWVVLQADGWAIRGTDAHGWVVAASIGDQWGAMRASWLQDLLDHARTDALGTLDLDARRRTDVRPPLVLDTRDVAFEIDHSGVRATMAPIPSSALAEALILPVVLIVLLGLLGSHPGWWLLVVAVVFAVLQRSIRRGINTLRSLHHPFVRVSTRTLRYEQGSFGYEVALADITAIHAGPGGLRIELGDDEPFTLGHGWPNEALQHLREAIDAARRAARAPEADDDPRAIPEALHRLRQGRAGSGARSRRSRRSRLRRRWTRRW